MSTPALECIVEARLADLMDPLNKRIDEVNRYIHRLFDNPAKRLPDVNMALRFRVNLNDVRHVDAMATDGKMFHEACGDVEAAFSRGIQGRLNWWNQVGLASLIAAADLRAKTPTGVLDEEVESIKNSIDYVVETYDELLTRLKSIWRKRSIWSRIGRRLTEAWTKLKNLFLRIPTMIARKIEFVQHVVDKLRKDEDPVFKAGMTLAAAAFSVAVHMFGGVQLNLLGLIASIRQALAPNSATRKTLDRIVVSITGAKAQKFVAGFKMKTRPPQGDFGRDSSSFDQPIKSTLDRIAAQIETAPFNRTKLRKLYEDVCLKNSNDKFHTIRVDDYKDILKLSVLDYLYRSPFTKRVYVFSGNPYKIAKQLQDSFTHGMAELDHPRKDEATPMQLRTPWTDPDRKKAADMHNLRVNLRDNMKKRDQDGAFDHRHTAPA